MPLRKILTFIYLLTLAAIYIYIATFHSKHMNISVEYPDQKPYLESAIKMKESGYKYLGDRNRMPAYPFLQSLFLPASPTPKNSFEKAKIINIALSLFLIALIYFAAAKYLTSLLNRITFITIAALGLYAMKAPYVQTELLFYSLNFLSFLSFLKLIGKPGIKIAALTGLLFGITYLSKGTIFLSFILGIIFIFVASLYNTLIKKRALSRVYMRSLAVFISSFLVLTSFYLIQNKTVFGRYFYNVNTTFYVWNDSIDESIAQTGSHGDTLRWPDMPKEELPSAGKYLREHSLSEIALRPVTGFARLMLFLIWTYAIIPVSFLMISIIFLSIEASFNLPEVKRIIVKHKLQTGFLFLYFLLNLGAFSWYARIDSGPRFILTLYLPLLFLAFLLRDSIRTKSNSQYSKIFSVLTISLIFLSVKFFILPLSKILYTGF